MLETIFVFLTITHPRKRSGNLLRELERPFEAFHIGADGRVFTLKACSLVVRSCERVLS